MNLPGQEFLELPFSEFIRKIEESGLAYCTYCGKTINYADRGITSIKAHVGSAKHLHRVKEKATHRSLDRSTIQAENYGLAPALIEKGLVRKSAWPEKNVSFVHRKENLQVIIVFFILFKG